MSKFNLDLPEGWIVMKKNASTFKATDGENVITVMADHHQGHVAANINGEERLLSTATPEKAQCKANDILAEAC